MPTPLYRPGMRMTAGRINAVLATWQSWVPAWTTGGSSTPNFGNSTVDGRYCRTGDLVVWKLDIVFGNSGVNFGSSLENWRFGLPVQAAAVAQNIGTGEIQDVSVGAGSRMVVRARCTNVNYFELEMSTNRIDNAAISGVGLIDNGSPWTWAAGDLICFEGKYEAA